MDDATYKNVTEFFEKENTRIGNRISWLFATQTLIFGAFEYVNNYEEAFRVNFLSAIAQIGFWTSLGFAFSILAAATNYMSIYYPLSSDGEKISTTYPYPNLRGGLVQRSCIPIGFFAAVLLPIIFATAWLNIPDIN